MTRSVTTPTIMTKIVPAIKKMDLLSERQRQRFAELGILQFENWADPFADHEKDSYTGAVSARLALMSAGSSDWIGSRIVCMNDPPMPANARTAMMRP